MTSKRKARKDKGTPKNFHHGMKFLGIGKPAPKNFENFSSEDGIAPLRVAFAVPLQRKIKSHRAQDNHKSEYDNAMTLPPQRCMSEIANSKTVTK